MKNNGFTLIELLAVIVILSVIALIATPMILNVIEETKISSDKISANNYADALEKQIIVNNIDYTNGVIKDGVYKISELSSKNFKVKGNNPSDNSWLKVQNGKVISYSLKFKEYTISLENKEIKAVKDGQVVTYKEYANGTEIYYNPEKDQKCTKSEADSNLNSNGTISEVKTGCMKWYTFNDEGFTESKINIILGHNTTNNAIWNSSGDNKNGMNEAKTVLINDTITWKSELRSTVRLITANEIVEITGYDNWDGGWYCLDANGTVGGGRCIDAIDGTSKFAWLYNNTSCKNKGCSISLSGVNGYWTSTPRLNNYAYGIDLNNALFYKKVDDSGYGIRPVITISKNKLM